MSVPVYRRSESSVNYLYRTHQLCIIVAHTVAKYPKKYRQNFGGKIIQFSLSALSHCITANNVFIGRGCKPEDVMLRRKFLQAVKGEVDSISTLADIFPDLCASEDGASMKKANKEKQQIGEVTYSISSMISGVIKSDNKVLKALTKT